jgi:GT2 family glycosyltransferase
MNNAAALLTRSELLLFINNDVAASAPGWFDAMAAQCLRSAIGCVGALLVYPDGTLQHAGMVLGMYGSAGHAYRHLSPEHSVHRGRSRYLTNWGAVTGACMMVKRELFELVAGFDEKLPVEFNDVDFCLRLAERGFRHLVVPEAVLVHRESQSRNATGSTTAAAALALMKERWPLRLANSRPWWPEACSLKWPDGRPLEFDDYR